MKLWNLIAKWFPWTVAIVALSSISIPVMAIGLVSISRHGVSLMFRCLGEWTCHGAEVYGYLQLRLPVRRFQVTCLVGCRIYLKARKKGEMDHSAFAFRHFIYCEYIGSKWDGSGTPRPMGHVGWGAKQPTATLPSSFLQAAAAERPPLTPAF